MTRRELLSLSAAGLAAGRRLVGQAAFPGVAYRDYSRCLPDYLRDLAGRAYQARNREILKLTTPAAVGERQRWAREAFWKLIGGMPERTALNARTLGSFERPGYRVEKVLYESRPGLHISANLYIPAAARPPFPGVLFQMGHSTNGKAAETYQRCCQGLVKQGYLVLAFDPMGQGERIYYPDGSGTRSRFSADNEHNHPGRQMLLIGDTSTRFQVWDAVRSLDYLAAHPSVDPQRLASTGQSGGGTLTMLLIAADDRLAAAAVCSGITENVACANFNPPGSTDDAEQDFVGSGPLGFDRWDLFYPLAPKPLLISVSDHDYFGTYSPSYISSGWEEYQKLKKVYEVLGHGDHLAWADTPLPHGLSYDSRLSVYSWFNHWLKGDTRRVEQEPETAPEPDQVLWVSPSGNVVRSFHGETPYSLLRAEAAKIHPAPLPLDRLLSVERPLAEAGGARGSTVLRSVPSHAIRIEALDIPATAHVWVPAWLFLPAGGDRSKPVVISLEPAGRNVRWQESGLYQSLAQAGYVVCVPDLRGVGDLAPEYGRGAARHSRAHEAEDEYAWSSLILGRSLVGQRVTDVLAVAQAMRRHPAAQDRRIVVAALQKMTVPALFAAALDANIQAVYLAGGLASYRSVVEAEQYNVPLVNFVPHVLEHTDLPEVAASLAPRRVILAGAVGASGAAMSAAEARQLYAQAGNTEIRAEASWDLAAFQQL